MKPPNPRAEALKTQGDEQISKRQFAEALQSYDQSLSLEANPALHYNRGRALQFLSRYGEAADAFERFLAEAPEELKGRVPRLAALVTELRSKVATLRLTSDVAGARVLVGGREMGVTPLAQPLKINAGKVTVELLADGYLPFRRDLDLVGGTSVDLDARLPSRDSSAYLVVRSTVGNTRVFVDGRALGVVPSESVLAPGQHDVRVEQDGYEDAQAQVALRKGDRRELTLDPIAKTPIARTWWFWTGIGVVVAGGTVAAILVAQSTERTAPEGNFTPGRVAF